MAERLAVVYGNQLQIPHFTASSAGIRAVIGHPIHHDAADVLQQLGGDGSDFTARQITARIVADADLILTMTRDHRNAVLELAPRKLRRTFTLAEASQLISEMGAQDVDQLATLRPELPSSDAHDILDPIGQTPEFFVAVGSQIADLLSPVVELCRRSSMPVAE